MIKSQLLNTIPSLKLRDMSNVCIENRRPVVANNPALEVATSMYYQYDDTNYCSKWDNLEILSSATFDETDDESNEEITWSYSLDRGCTEWDGLEIETAKTFDEDVDEDCMELILDLEIIAAKTFDDDDDDESLSDDERSFERLWLEKRRLSVLQDSRLQH